MVNQVINMQPQAGASQMTIAQVEQKAPEQPKNMWEALRIRGGGAARDCCLGIFEIFICFESCKVCCECGADIICCPCETAGC